MIINKKNYVAIAEAFRAATLSPTYSPSEESLTFFHEVIDFVEREARQLNRRSERDMNIFSDWVSGFSLTELSRKYGVSSSRISQIRNRMRRRAMWVLPPDAKKNVDLEDFDDRSGKLHGVDKKVWLTAIEDLKKIWP